MLLNCECSTFSQVRASNRYPREISSKVVINLRNLTNVLMTNEMHNSYNQFYSTAFCLLYVFRTSLVVHHQEHGIIYCITQFGTVGQKETL